MKKYAVIAALAVMTSMVGRAMATTYTSLDNMDAVTGWNTYQDNTVVNTVASVEGQTGNALEITYAMNTGSWLGISKTPAATDLSGMTSLRFRVKGTGTGNTIQVKIADTTGRVFGANLTTPLSNASDWTTVEIQKTDFAYFWGGANSSMDWAHIQTLDFALSGASGAGTMLIDTVETGVPDAATGNTTGVTVTVLNASVSVEVTGNVSLGTIVAGQSAVSASAVSVRNAGTGNATFKLALANPADWTAATTSGPNQYVLNGAFASASGAIAWSEANDNITTASVACTATQFAGDETGASVPAGAVRSLWFQFKAPTVVSDETAHTVNVTVTAVAVP